MIGDLLKQTMDLQAKIKKILNAKDATKKAAVSEPPRYDEVWARGVKAMNTAVRRESRWYLSYRPFEHHPEEEVSFICPGDGYISYDVATVARKHLGLFEEFSVYQPWQIREQYIYTSEEE